MQAFLFLKVKMLLKSYDLKGIALDWAVAKAQGFSYEKYQQYRDAWSTAFYRPSHWKPSQDWAQGDPIIEQQIDEISRRNSYPDYTAKRFACDDWEDCKGVGPTPLIAAMRCYVKSQFGDEIEIPDNLLKD